MAKTEPYLEHIESKEIKKLVHRLYQDQQDLSLEGKQTEKGIKQSCVTSSNGSHDYIASEIDKLLEANNSLEKHAEPTNTPLPEFPATEKPKKIEKPERPEKKRGIFSFFKK